MHAPVVAFSNPARLLVLYIFSGAKPRVTNMVEWTGEINVEYVSYKNVSSPAAIDVSKILVTTVPMVGSVNTCRPTHLWARALQRWGIPGRQTSCSLGRDQAASGLALDSRILPY
ncbi:hypothetical protein E2C01_001921 [Portunus trituberculatus]|uniref:Uncharacterized protein n=1 Tax=Portunus trituberculatus TaxID=210409 RepID=A0A5B7CNX7_PORTR|nr:hypothetical protein [Portunus trituberculatus]